VFAVIFGATLANYAVAGEVPFSSGQAIGTSASGTRPLLAADLDGDGDNDVVAAVFGEDALSWFENTDGVGTFGSERAIASGLDFVGSVIASDLDKDGDLDLLAACRLDDTISWFENVDGAGTFGAAQEVTALVDSPYSVFSADLDGDGDLDVLSASNNDDKVAWYENTDGAGSFGGQQVITLAAGEATAAVAGDVDGDGDLDVVFSAATADKVGWFENTDGAGTFGTEQVISTSIDSARFVFTADLDGDGDLDVFASSQWDNRNVWFENTDGAGSFGPAQWINIHVDEGYWAIPADLDADGDLDVVGTHGEDSIAWYENLDGTWMFDSERLIATDLNFVATVIVADIDGDGDLDAVSTSPDDKMVWYENQTIHRSAYFPEETVISESETDDPDSVFAADLDGDGDLDVLAASYAWDRISWYENTDGAGTFGPQQVITTLIDRGNTAIAADVDRDGDLDVLSASFRDDKIAWYENTDGEGAFGPQQRINGFNEGKQVSSVFAGDIDGDGDVDVFSTSINNDEVSWYENTDGAGTFGAQQIITREANGAYWVIGADLDRDGDLDAVSASFWDDKIAWYENMDGVGTFGAQRVISTLAGGAIRVFAADLDGDGDLDVLSASSSNNKIAWYENTDGDGTFGDERLITNSADGAFWVHAADFDADGDLDVLSASTGDDRVIWYENTDGEGTFGLPRVITDAADAARSVHAADINGDGRIDALSASLADGTLAWYDNRGGQFSLATTDVAQGYVGNSQEVDLLSIVVAHNGREGDSPLELSSLALRFADDDDSALTEAQAAALFTSISIYLDDGSGVLDEADVAVVATSDFSSITTNGNGILTLPIADGDANARVEFATPRTYLVAVELAGDANQQMPSVVSLEHRTDPSPSVPEPITVAKDALANLELTPEPVENVLSLGFETELSDLTCIAPFDLRLEHLTIESALVCEAGTVLEAGREFTVSAPGDVTFRAGEAVVLSDGFSISGDKLAIEVNSEFKPE